jgi:hypothetical protein
MTGMERFKKGTTKSRWGCMAAPVEKNKIQEESPQQIPRQYG